MCKFSKIENLKKAIAASQHDILHEIYERSRNKDTDGALDIIYEHIDVLLESQQFTIVDQLLESVDVSLLDVPTMLGFLSSTFLFKDKLIARKKYSQSVRQQLLVQRTGEEIAQLESLL